MLRVLWFCLEFRRKLQITSEVWTFYSLQFPFFRNIISAAIRKQQGESLVDIVRNKFWRIWEKPVKVSLSEGLLGFRDSLFSWWYKVRLLRESSTRMKISSLPSFYPPVFRPPKPLVRGSPVVLTNQSKERIWIRAEDDARDSHQMLQIVARLMRRKFPLTHVWFRAKREILSRANKSRLYALANAILDAHETSVIIPRTESAL